MCCLADPHGCAEHCHDCEKFAKKAQGYAVEVNAEDMSVKCDSAQAKAVGERRDNDSGAGGCERDLPRQGIRTYSQDENRVHASV